MGLFHEVAPADDALACASCHRDRTKKWTGAELFTKVHAKHVDDRKLDCSTCHGFRKAA